MREIKFRAYCDIGDENKMVYFTEGKYDNGLWFEHTSNHIDEYLSPLMQFTGLKDKNEKDIYEGDILNCQDRIVKVVWHEQAAQFDTDFISYIFDLCSNGITNQEWKYRVIVIGNIYENPELC